MRRNSSYWDKVSNSIRQVVHERQIEYLLHFTRLEYLPTILEYGIRTTEEVREAGAEIPRPLNGREDTVSASISSYYPKFFWSRREDAGNEPFVILLLYPDLLWEEYCEFYRRSAARSSTVYEVGKRFGGFALERLFDDLSPSGDGIGTGFRAKHCLPACVPTFADAEVQFVRPIDPRYIQGAWVETDEHADLVHSVFLAAGRKDYRLEVQPFKPRIDQPPYQWG